jgi:hypothetical protein
MKLRHALLLSTLVALLLAPASGCSQKKVEELPNPMLLPITDRDLVRHNINDVLEIMFFEIERPPRAPDRVDTYPMVAAYFLEFWRHDVTTSYDRAESALHTMRWTVTIYMRPASDAPAADGERQTAGPQEAAKKPAASEDHQEKTGSSATLTNGMMVEVVAKKERVDLGKSLTTSDFYDLYGVFQSETKILEQYETKWEPNVRWIDYGRDAGLEQKILRRIQKRF